MPAIFLKSPISSNLLELHRDFIFQIHPLFNAIDSRSTAYFYILSLMQIGCRKSLFANRIFLQAVL
ncbi:hypothetical protein LDG_7283 [Legionella drancourtii LLAP12]|uniref:Uncharacterized protein n=1 Tax=Legionella drancourtii LLAP12 TaxID=658187 RepID=G9EPU2_9GAMM|nr:hypothetical protein LDG_7283 [Legionella drancourtii LLAP12]